MAFIFRTLWPAPAFLSSTSLSFDAQNLNRMSNSEVKKSRHQRSPDFDWIFTKIMKFWIFIGDEEKVAGESLRVE